jgi:PAS domain S-box-containing protein
MVKRHPSTFFLFLLLSLIVLLHPSNAKTAGQSPGNVLILNSYHQGEDWSDNEIAGIFSQLREEHPYLIPMVETLDTKRFPSPSHLDTFKDTLSRKYHARTIDVIMALDNPALDLLVRHADSLFPGVPVVFAGINGYRPAMTAGRERVTGVIEQQDVAGTLAMALSLRPGVSKVLAVHDYTASGLAVRQEAETALAQFAGKVDIAYSTDVPFSELSEELKAMPRDGVVLILTYVTDKAGRTFTREESTRLIASLSPAPVYAMHETRLGFGIVGGLLLEGKEHGQQAAAMAHRILEGADPGQMPVEVSRSRSILDHRELLRFHITEHHWPKEAVVINRPISFWDRYGAVLLPAGATIAVMGLLLSILIAVVIRLRRAQGALSASEERYRETFELAVDGILEGSADGRIRGANVQMQKWLGRPLEQLLGLHISELFDPQELKAKPLRFDQLNVAELVVNERNLCRPHGTNLPVEMHSKRMPDGTYQSIFRDITERKRAEALARQRELFLRTVIETTADGFWVVDAGGRIIEVNEAYCIMSGFSKDELVGRHSYEIDAVETPEQTRERIGRITVTGRDLFESWHRRKDGTLLPLEISVTFLAEQGGRIVCFCRDLSERKQAEETLRQKQALLDATQNLARIGGWEWHVADQTMTWTEETFRIHGLTPEDQSILSAKLIDLSLACYHEEDRPKIIAAFRHCIEEGRPYDEQFPFRSNDGRDLWIRTMAEPVFADGRIVLVRGTIMDISREKRLELLLAARLRLSELPTTLSLEDLLATVMDEAEKLTGSNIGFFHFVDPDQQTLTLQAWSRNTTAHFCKVEGKGLHHRLAEAGVWVDCLRQRKVVIHNDYASLPHRKGLPPGHAPVIRELVLPVFKGGDIVAIFGVGNKKQDYNQDDIDMVTALGDLIWDIILRRRAEEESRLSEERFRLSFDRSPLGIAMISPDFRFLRANDALCRLLGYSEEELVSLTFADLTHPEERQRDLGQVRGMLAGEIDNYDVEKRYLHRNGEIIWAKVNVTLLRDGERQPLFFLPIIQDITDRKRAEQQLQDQVDFTQRVLDSAPSQIAILDNEGVIIDVNTPWNRFAEENNGTARERLGPGANYFCPWSPEHGDTTNAAPAFEGIRQVQLGELEDFQIDYPCHSPQEERWFTMRVLPLTGAPGQVLVSHTDITALKETEQHLVAALAEKEVLLREVHHRVKNNLAAIIALLDMQRRFLKDTEGLEVLTELANRIRSMSLIHEKLYRSSDLAHINFQDYLQALLSHLCTSFGSPGIRCLAEAKGVTLPLDLAVPCGMIINELVTNALKYAFPPQLLESARHACFIRVTMHQENAQYTLVVVDNGVGLPDGYDWMNATTLGMTLVRMLGRHQLGGHLTLKNDQGLQITLTFTERRGKQ